MPARNVILRIMLWSLGLAAATGVLTVLVQSGSVMWRIIGTELCAAAACAVTLAFIPLIDREQTRAGGLLGMVGVVVEFILALIVIWELPRTLTGVRWEDEFLLTMLLLGLATLVAIPLLKLKHQIEHTVGAWFGLAVIAAAVCLFLIAIWRHRHYDFSDNCAESATALLVVGAITAICLLGYRPTFGSKPEPQASSCADSGEQMTLPVAQGQSSLSDLPRRPWRWVGVGCATGAFALWLGDIWIGSGSDIGFVTFTGLLATSAVTAYAIACQFVPLKPAQLWFRGATIIAAVVTVGLIELWMIVDRGLIVGIDKFWIERCTAASGIVTGCSTLALAVLARMNRRVDFEMEHEALTEIVVVCPRCRKKQSLRIGDATCSGCQLRISTRVEEPRCPTCDYLLIGLTSNRCPECGTEISQSRATS